MDGERFDTFVEALSAKFYAPQFGRPSLLPGVYFRSLLIGYFEGIEGERGIAWRVAMCLWYDYYNNGLARPGTPNGIDALMLAHHHHAGGDSQILHADPDLYIMQCVVSKDEGTDQPGLIYVLNNLCNQ